MAITPLVDYLACSALVAVTRARIIITNVRVKQTDDGDIVDLSGYVA